MAKRTIDRFVKTNYFLSNFYPCEVRYNGLTYQNAEAAYQAQKTLDEKTQKMFCSLLPQTAKTFGARIPLRPEWDDIKMGIMWDVLNAKFKQHPELLLRLIATDGIELIEGNWWGDTYWGICQGVGENHLGKMLMQIREDNRLKE